MVCATIIDRIIGLDQQLTLFLNDINCAASNQFWLLFSSKYIWTVAYLVCAFFLFKRLGWRKALLVLLSIALTFAVCDQFSNVVKYSTCRLRPGYNYWMVRRGVHILEGKGGFYSFFSAHAANAFAVAVCLIIGFRNDSTHTYNAFCIWSLIWALLVSVSRIFVGKHFFLDVVVGIVIGITLGILSGMLTRYLIQKYIDKVKPTGFNCSFLKIPVSTTKE
ncbi:MAG: phosphatase PAP2 family protein [Candidatus Cryptobacteroides sp.]